MNRYKLSSYDSVSINSSGGQLLKWKIGDRYIKTSTLDKQSLKTKFMYESYAEVIASKLGRSLGLDIVDYSLCEVVIDGSISTIAYESKDFKTRGYIEYSFGKLMQEGKIPLLEYGRLDGYKALLENVGRTLKLNIQKYVDTLIVFDSLILNDDRHYGNFGFIGDRRGLRVLPIFDNGNSLFCHKHIDEMEYDSNLIQYLRFRPFSVYCDEQIRLVCNNPITKLRGMSGYREVHVHIHRILEEMTVCGFPLHRASFIEALLVDRLKHIMMLQSKG